MQTQVCCITRGIGLEAVWWNREGWGLGIRTMDLNLGPAIYKQWDLGQVIQHWRSHQNNPTSFAETKVHQSFSPFVGWKLGEAQPDITAGGTFTSQHSGPWPITLIFCGYLRTCLRTPPFLPGKAAQREFLRSLRPLSARQWAQGWPHNYGTLIQKLFWISRQQQPSIHQAQGPSAYRPCVTVWVTGPQKRSGELRPRGLIHLIQFNETGPNTNPNPISFSQKEMLTVKGK